MSEKNQVEKWFDRRHLILDLAGLTEEDRKEGSILLGGSGGEFISLSDNFEYDQVKLVVFNWGDYTIDHVTANLLKHEDTPGKEYVPFNLSAVIGDQVWSLTIQDRDFDPSVAYRDQSLYWIIPFDAVKGQESLQGFLSLPAPRPEVLAKVGLCWVVFEMGTDIRQNQDDRSSV